MKTKSILTVLLLCVYCFVPAQAEEPFAVPDWRKANWQDVPENPLVGREIEKPGQAIGDPQVLLPGEFDDKWHMFYHGFHFNPGATTFFHQTSDDGLHWKEVSRSDGEVGIQYVFCAGDQWIQYYTATCFKTGDPSLAKFNTIIRARTTKDFVTWSKPINLILPEHPKELERAPIGYNAVEVRNPCVILLPDGRYRMYYCGGTVWLDDCGYAEPKNIFVAESDNPLGPFKKRGEPILEPDEKIPYMNMSAGAIKVFGYKDGYIAFHNPIYRDKENKSRSEIRMLYSKDGLDWKEAFDEPVVTPDPQYKWRSAIIYQLDVVTWNDALLMYFNAREGWRGGIECIGAVRLQLNGGAPLVKLQKTFKK